MQLTWTYTTETPPEEQSLAAMKSVLLSIGQRATRVEKVGQLQMAAHLPGRRVQCMATRQRDQDGAKCCPAQISQVIGHATNRASVRSTERR